MFSVRVTPLTPCILKKSTLPVAVPGEAASMPRSKSKQFEGPISVECCTCRVIFMSDSAAYMPETSLQSILCIDCTLKQMPSTNSRKWTGVDFDNIISAHKYQSTVFMKKSSVLSTKEQCASAKRKRSKRVTFRIGERIFVPGCDEPQRIVSITSHLQDSRTHLTVTRRSLPISSSKRAKLSDRKYLEA